MREPIIASDGHILTNGKVYGRMIYLADGMDASEFYEITEAMYDEIMTDEEPSDADATEADYIAALGEMGVNV